MTNTHEILAHQIVTAMKAVSTALSSADEDEVDKRIAEELRAVQLRLNALGVDLRSAEHTRPAPASTEPQQGEN